MNVEYFKQCKLRRGNVETRSWIPEHVAKEGQAVRLRKTKGSPWEYWVIASVGSRVSKEDVRVLNQQYKRTRKVSDI